MISSTTTGHLQDNQGFRSTQHGIRKGRSCLNVLVNYTLRKSADDTNLAGSVDLLECRNVLERYLLQAGSMGQGQLPETQQVKASCSVEQEADSSYIR